MASPDRLLAFAAPSFLIIVIPGPGVLFVGLPGAVAGPPRRAQAPSRSAPRTRVRDVRGPRGRGRGPAGAGPGVETVAQVDAWSLSFIAPQPCQRSTSTQALTRGRTRSG